MQKLTENVIIQKIRPCPSDLSKITQLNVTARGLTDVSLIRRLVGLEVISLSFNNISSLVCFENCKNLKALYLRQNKIEDLMEIKYLVHLPKLEVLTLSQNPCTEEPFYRWTVVKNLKHLIELDDISVGEEDKREAELLGRNLPMQASSCHIISNREGPRVRRSRSRANQALKVASTTTIPETKVCFERVRKNGSVEESVIGAEHPRKLRISTRYTRSYYDEIVPGLFSVESLSGLSPSQCRIFQGSTIDLSSTSSQALPIIEEPTEPSNLLMAALFLIRDLGSSDLERLLAELTGMLNTMLPPDRQPSEE